MSKALENKVKLNDIVSVKDFGAIGNGINDDTAEIQAAIDAVYLRNGGEVFFPIGTYLVSSTIVVPQRVTLVGESSAFANQYINVQAAPRGSTLFAATGMNSDIVQITCNLYVDGGILKETTLGTENRDARHFGGMRDMIVWGNRSTTAAPTAVDRNSTGHGILIRGARYVTIENVVSMFCGDDGMRTTERDYGTGLLGVNNTRIVNYSGLSNNGHGLYLSIGDSFIDSPNCGYNGDYGIVENMGNSVINGGVCWNNASGGVYSGPNNETSVSKIIGLHSYDNDGPGFYQGSSGGLNTLACLIGCTARGNGRDATKAPSLRSNFFISSSSTNWHWSGCLASAYDQTGAITSQYGFYVATSEVGVFGADNISRAAAVSNYFFTSASAQLVHNGTTRHPGFLATSNIDLNTFSLFGTGAVRFSAWETFTSITSNTITVNPQNSLITLNCTGTQTVNDISFSGTGIPILIIRNISTDAVTFTHNTAKLRLANATNVVLGQNETIMFLYVSGTVWQQVATAN